MTGTIRHRPALLLLCSLAWFSSAEGSPGTAERSTAGGTPLQVPAAPLRDPPAVRERLREICESAGYGTRSYRQCAQAIARQCRSAGVAPDSARCWQWLVDQDVTGELNRSILRRAGR